jgi:hypothetical protein
VWYGKGFDEHPEQIGFSQQNDRVTPLSLMFACSVHSAQGIVIEGIVFKKRDIFFNNYLYSSCILYFFKKYLSIFV